jgi:FkbM family methyltransferase
MFKSIALRVLPGPILKYLKKVHYSYELKRFSEKDEPDLRVVKELIRMGDYVVDVGANVGWYTKVLAELVSSEGRVYSIEPMPMTFEILSYCVHQLGLKNIELFCCGISEATGEGLMEIPSFKKGGDNFYMARIVSGDNRVEKGNKRIQVHLRSLDEMLLGSKSPIKFIKCDVEGHELSAVKGARAVIEKFRPALLIEVSHDPDEIGSSSNELFSILRSYDYKVFWFNGENLIERAARDRSVNYFFLTAEQVRLYNARNRFH